MAKASVGKTKGRSVWWWVHHWLGLKLALFMTFILATGTLAVLAHEIDWMIDPAMRVMPQAEAPASWGALASAVRVVEPNARLESLSAPIDPWFAATAVIVRPDDSRRFVYLNPWTSQVQGVRGYFNVHRFLRNTHRHLMMPIDIGLPIVCSLALVLIASLITGLVTYKKFWRGFLRVPQWKSGRTGEGRRFTGDLHRFAGLWSLWFVAVIAASGLWYLVEWGGGEAPRLPQPEAITGPAQIDGPALARLVAAGQAVYPRLRITGISFPGEKGRGLKLEGQAGAILVRERANAVWIDPDTTGVSLVVQGDRLGVHQRISEMADPLHFGTFGGIATKLIWFAFGVILTGLSVTGVMIYSLRMGRTASTSARSRGLIGLWNSLGPAAYPTAALILLSLALTPGADGRERWGIGKGPPPDREDEPRPM